MGPRTQPTSVAHGIDDVNITLKNDSFTPHISVFSGRYFNQVPVSQTPPEYNIIMLFP